MALVLTRQPLVLLLVPPTASTAALELVSSTPGCVTATLTVLMAAMSWDVPQVPPRSYVHVCMSEVLCVVFVFVFEEF